ncbi:MAG: hypothetical protein JOY89_26845 [Solirubrobacterales bacterium]|nr:hypothetical protein [Solirubrobacterales bacterium]
MAPRRAVPAVVARGVLALVVVARALALPRRGPPVGGGVGEPPAAVGAWAMFTSAGPQNGWLAPGMSSRWGVNLCSR